MPSKLTLLERRLRDFRWKWTAASIGFGSRCMSELTLQRSAPRVKKARRRALGISMTLNEGNAAAISKRLTFGQYPAKARQGSGMRMLSPDSKEWTMCPGTS